MASRRFASMFSSLSALMGATLFITACSPSKAPAIDRPVAALTTGTDGATTEPAAALDSGASSTELTVWYFDKVSMETVIPLFEQSHPGVKVNFVEQPFGDMSKKYLAALAAKQGCQTSSGWTPAWLVSSSTRAKTCWPSRTRLDS